MNTAKKKPARRPAFLLRQDYFFSIPLGVASPPLVEPCGNALSSFFISSFFISSAFISSFFISGAGAGAGAGAGGGGGGAASGAFVGGGGGGGGAGLSQALKPKANRT